MNKIPLVAIVGPTASGKSRLGVEIAKLANGEIVSADSMQIYKSMNIATAKPSAIEMESVPHHLIDIVEPDESFSVVQYCKLAGAIISDINCRGKLPIIVGGTGLYIDALIDNIEFPDVKADMALRERLTNTAQAEGAEALLAELRNVDMETARNLHPNDLARIIRALELFYTTGLPMSRHVQLSRLQPSPYEVLFIGLDFQNRQLLYDRINSRVDSMLENGLLKEAEDFCCKYRSGTAQQAIGYKELAPYFEGKITLSEAIENLKRETRRYAKRQLTWFRKNSRMNWIYVDWCNGPNDVTAQAYDLILNAKLRG